MLNNISYVGPNTPSLMTMLSMGEDALNPVVYGPQTAQHLLTKNDVMDLMVINFDANAHPFVRLLCASESRRPGLTSFCRCSTCTVTTSRSHAWPRTSRPTTLS